MYTTAICQQKKNYHSPIYTKRCRILNPPFILKQSTLCTISTSPTIPSSTCSSLRLLTWLVLLHKTVALQIKTAREEAIHREEEEDNDELQNENNILEDESEHHHGQDLNQNDNILHLQHPPQQNDQPLNDHDSLEGEEQEDVNDYLEDQHNLVEDEPGHHQDEMLNQNDNILNVQNPQQQGDQQLNDDHALHAEEDEDDNNDNDENDENDELENPNNILDIQHDHHHNQILHQNDNLLHVQHPLLDNEQLNEDNVLDGENDDDVRSLESLAEDEVGALEEELINGYVLRTILQVEKYIMFSAEQLHDMHIIKHEILLLSQNCPEVKQHYDSCCEYLKECTSSYNQAKSHFDEIHINASVRNVRRWREHIMCIIPNFTRKVHFMEDLKRSAVREDQEARKEWLHVIRMNNGDDNLSLDEIIELSYNFIHRIEDVYHEFASHIHKDDIYKRLFEAVKSTRRNQNVPIEVVFDATLKYIVGGKSAWRKLQNHERNVKVKLLQQLKNKFIQHNKENKLITVMVGLILLS